jgi:fructokinase
MDKTLPPEFWAGGTCANVLGILSALGWAAYPIARLRRDWASTQIKRDLGLWGIGQQYLNLSPTVATPVIVHRVRDDLAGGPLHIFSWLCPRCKFRLPQYRAVRIKEIGKIVHAISKPTVCFIDRASPGAVALAQACSERGALVMFEPSAGSDESSLRLLLRTAHVLKYSIDHRGHVPLGSRGSTMLLEIQTLGARGLRFRSRIPSARTAGWEHLPAVKTASVVDAAGAGDWCSAGFVFKLGLGGLHSLRQITIPSLRAALSFGQTLASWNCQFEGARGALYSALEPPIHLKRSSIAFRKLAHLATCPRRHLTLAQATQKVCPRCGASKTRRRHA